MFISNFCKNLEPGRALILEPSIDQLLVVTSKSSVESFSISSKFKKSDFLDLYINPSIGDIVQVCARNQCPASPQIKTFVLTSLGYVVCQWEVGNEITRSELIKESSKSCQKSCYFLTQLSKAKN